MNARSKQFDSVFIVLNVALVSIFLLIILIGIKGEYPNALIRFLFSCNIILCIYGLVASVSNPYQGALGVVFWVFNGALVIVPGMVHVTRGEFVWPVVHTPEDIEKTLYMILVAQLSFLMGTHFSSKTRLPHFRGLNLTMSTVSPFILYCLLIPGAVSILVIGPVVFFVGRFDVASASTGFTGQLLMVGKSMTLFALLLGFVTIRNSRTNKNVSPLHLLFWVIAISVAMFILNPLSSSRNWVMAALVAFFVIYTSPYSVKQRTLGVPLLIVLFLSVMQTVKGLGANSMSVAEKSFSFQNPFNLDWLDRYVMTTDFDAFQMSMNPMIFYDIEGFRFGYNFLGLLFFWIPSELWSSKPGDSAAIAAEGFNYTFTNLSCPIYTEFYASFGWIGVVLGMILLGYVVARLDRRAHYYLAYGRLDMYNVFYACAVGFFPITLRGPLNGTFPQYGFVLFIPLVLMYYPRLSRLIGIGR